MKIVMGALAVVLTLPMLVHAQQVTGVWEGQTPSRQPIRLELAAKGNDLKGTMTVGGEKAPVANGKVSKNTITFSVTMGGGTEAFTGELTDDQQMKMWMDDRGPAAAITLKRSEPARK
jgi:hypothetical protein